MENRENKRDEFVWVRCSNCGHKLFKLMDWKIDELLYDEDRTEIEIKCHSCKIINKIYV